MWRLVSSAMYIQVYSSSLWQVLATLASFSAHSPVVSVVGCVSQSLLLDKVTKQLAVAHENVRKLWMIIEITSSQNLLKSMMLTVDF